MNFDASRPSTLPVYSLKQEIAEAAERLDALAPTPEVRRLAQRLDEAKRRLEGVGGTPGASLEHEILALRDEVSNLWAREGARPTMPTRPI